MKDHLRPNEFDGIGNMCELRAIAFAEWIHRNTIPEQNNHIHKFYFFKDKNYVSLSTEQLYKEYLKILTV